MKFTDKIEPETCTEECECNIKAFNVMELSQLTVQMQEGDLLNQFLIFLGEGKDLFAKYGFTTYDNKGLRYVTISSELDNDIEDYDMTQDFDALLYSAFQGDNEASMITFDISFISKKSRRALQDTLALYMNDYKKVTNESFGINNDVN